MVEKNPRGKKKKREKRMDVIKKGKIIKKKIEMLLQYFHNKF